MYVYTHWYNLDKISLRLLAWKIYNLNFHFPVKFDNFWDLRLGVKCGRRNVIEGVIWMLFWSSVVYMLLNKELGPRFDPLFLELTVSARASWGQLIFSNQWSRAKYRWFHFPEICCLFYEFVFLGSIEITYSQHK